MVTLYKYEGKTEEEALKLCLNELNITEEEIYYVVNVMDGSLFKSKKVIIEAIIKKEIILFVKEFFKQLSSLMNLEINLEVKITENILKILLVSNNNNILIGKDGKTLSSLSIILKQTLKELSKFDIKIVLDVSNYKENRQKHLEYEIKKICKEVINSKVEVKLDPMNSYERRLVHTIVSEYEKLESESFGENKERYTVIKYKD